MKNIIKILCTLMVALMVVGCGVEKVENKVVTIQPDDSTSEFSIKNILKTSSFTGSYTGDIKGDKPHGNGVFKFHIPSGAEMVYTGGFKNGKFDGSFIMNDTANAVRYEGAYKEGLIHGNSKWYQNGQLYSEIEYKDGKVNGITKKYYDNGQLESEMNVKEEVKDGKPIFYGIIKEYYDNGQLKTETNDNKDGKKLKKYYQNGQLEFDLDISYSKDGKSYGKAKTYYDNGQMRFDIEVLGNESQGTEYNRDGSIKHKGKFINDKPVT